MRRGIVVAAALVAVLAAPRGAAADSVFGIRGLGLLGRPISGRSAGSGSAFVLLDATSPLNPASFAQLTVPTGWATGAGTSRAFTDGGLGATLTSTRFPLFGLAAPLGQRAVIGVTIGDYLDRTWAVNTTGDTTLRDSTITYTDQARSTGGVTDIRFAGAYRVTDAIAVGLGLHLLTGSTRLAITRTFSSTAFIDFNEVAITSYSGFGVSVGVVGRLSGQLAFGASARFNGRLKASELAGPSASIAMPSEFGAGVVWIPTAGLSFAMSAGYQTWSRSAADLATAGSPGTRSVWNVAAGAEISTVRFGEQPLPLRIGYRYRQLPFPVGTAPLSESALTGGFGLAVAGGRATIDLAIERGSRSGGGARERFTTGFVGLTVRP